MYNPKSFKYYGPKYLYKYRPFDEHTYDMLTTKTIYLCPANKLDDKTECDTTMTLENYYDYKASGLKTSCVGEILNLIKPYCSKESFEEIVGYISQTIRRNGTIDNSYLLDVGPSIQELVPNVNVSHLINWIINIPTILEKPEIKSQLEDFFALATLAKEKMGICSFSEEMNDIDLWEGYADGSTGYCIEYNVEEYEFNVDILPTIYDANREKNIIKAILNNFIAQTITGLSNNEIKLDASQIVRLFISKHPEWESQKEWRLLGNAGSLQKAPKIKRIIIGKNATAENKMALIKYCNLNHIEYENQE